jgi:prolyl-tRNA editing enzyme YbaK/EbsC (Cys-tRNA(Pro) deacylase)
MRGALDVHRDLLAQDVAHEVVRLRRPVVSADDLPEVLDLPASSCVAVRCYVVDGRTVAVMMQAGDVPDPAALLDALGACKARPATATEVNAATDFAAGLVSPVGLPPAVELLADRALDRDEVLYAPAGESGVVLAVRSRELLAATGARLVALSPQPLSEADRAGWDGVLETSPYPPDARTPSTPEPPRAGAGRVLSLPDRPAARGGQA